MGIDAYHTPDESGWATWISFRPCIDRVDNDEDGFADFDGIDFDIDGIHEIPPDPGCTARLATTEITECQDLIDNDGDGQIDLADSSCLTPNSLSESAFVPACGDGITTLPETCDDGNVLAGYGCYSNCRIEDNIELLGVAQGGSVSVTISGVVVMTTTTLGETSEQVITNISVAVNTNMALQTLDLSATAITSSLFTDGVIEDLTIVDGGLFDAPPPPTVPTLAPGGLFVPWSLG
jgi:cysteine-rich repeat protein